MERRWPLVGRDAELRAVRAAVRSGEPGIVVAGPPGVGKTRLVRDALADHAAGQRWAHGSTAARAVPLGAFAGVVDTAGVDDALDTVARVLAALAAARPLVLAVDDAHLLDELSAIVVHRVVVRRLAPVVLTVRDGVPAPDLVTALWKDDHLPRLDLAPLDADATTTLVAEVLRGPVDSGSARRLWTLTEGRPLFLRHLLAGEVDSGRFVATRGLWCWRDEPGISPELDALLAREIGALSPQVQDVVDLVALAEPLPTSTLVELTAPEAVETAEARGLVLADAAQDVTRLAHPLYGEVRRAAMGRVRARRLRGLVAATLDGGADPVARAVLAVDSDLPPDPGLFLRAAEVALGSYNVPLAERLARAAAAGGDRQARLVHASTLSWLSRGEEAEALLAELARSAPDPADRAVVNLYRTGNLLWTLADPDGARRVLAAARQDAVPIPVRRQVEAMTAALAASLGDVPAALERGVALLDGEPDGIALVLAASAVAAGAAVSGRDDLLDRAARAGGEARLPNAVPAFGLADWLVLGHRLAGRPRAAADSAAPIVTAAADLPGPARLMGLVVAGHVALAEGLVGEALTSLREAWAALASSGHEFRYRCRTLLATAYGLAGRAAEARALLTGHDAGPHPAYRLYAPDDLLAAAWAAAAEGSTSEAVRAAAEAAALAERQHSPAYQVLAWQTAVQLGAPEDAVPHLEALAPYGGPRAAVALAHATALAAGDAAGLTEVAARWERLGDLVAAGDAFAQAAGVHRRQGRRGPALTAAEAARRLAVRSGARTPALAAAETPLPLTAREREIVTLAARGLSNRDIAARLTVSVRTVEGHLYRAGHKLGVSDRADLAAILGGSE